MKWIMGRHIVGKVYDLTQENMNAMIADIERLMTMLQDNTQVTLSEAPTEEESSNEG